MVILAWKIKQTNKTKYQRNKKNKNKKKGKRFGKTYVLQKYKICIPDGLDKVSIARKDSLVSSLVDLAKFVKVKVIHRN